MWTRQCPSSDEDTASHHHTAAISRHLLPSPPTTDAQQPPATDHNIVMFPRSLPHHTPHTSPLPTADVTTGHWSLLGTVPHHHHHGPGCGCAGYNEHPVCGDEITAAPHSARWTLTQFYLVPGWCPASQHRPGSHQPRSLAVRTFSFPTGCHCHQPSVRPRSVPRRDHSRGRTAAAAPGPRRCQGTWHPQLEHAAAKIS